MVDYQIVIYCFISENSAYNGAIGTNFGNAIENF